MKKIYILFTFVLATIAMLAVGCQKEESTVTLGAEIQRPVSSDTKVYIDDHTPCWHNGDEVYINNTAYPVMASTGTSARIENVISSSIYRAIFPASLVTTGSDISSNSSISVTLPTTQHYELVGSHQLVDVPMGAFLTSGSTLQFYNLCSIVRVIVSNSLNRELQLSRIELRAETAMLSGQGTAIVSGQSTDHITLSSTASHSVNLNFINDISVTVEARGSRMFDIVVPAFTTDDVTLTLYTTDGYYSEVTKEEVALAHNTITTVTMNVSSLTEVVAAELVDGPTFNRIMNRFPLAVYSATSIVFEYGSSMTSGIILSTADSPVPIYANRVGSVVRISTSARMINANPDCSFMFGCDWVGDGVGDPMETIDFGSGFNTTNVTDMQGMFDGLGALRNLDVSNFNTSNVTTMYGMFGHCHNLANIDVSHFNTSNVTDMSEMFACCSDLSSLDVSNFNTSNVTNMSNMFNNCSDLTNLNLSNFNTSNVTSMSGMFAGCGLTNLDLSNFNTSNVTDMRWMFFYCNSLTSLNLSNFNTSNVTSMSEMFYSCNSLTDLNISSFNTQFVEDMGGMFYNCSSLTSLNLSSFYTTNVSNMQAMFMYCGSLENLNLAHFDMSHLSDHNYNGNFSPGKCDMCYGLSTTSHSCIITCPEAVQMELVNGTGLPSSGVVFTWVTSSSK